MTAARTSKPPVEQPSRTARRWVFAAAQAPVADTPVALDLTAWLSALGTELAAVASLPVAITTTATAAPPTSAFVRSDGLTFVADMPRELAAAVVGQRCGGAFDAAGVDLSAPSVSRVHHDLLAAACRAADHAWPVEAGTWTHTVADKTATTQAVNLTIAGQSFALSFVLIPPPTPLGVAPVISPQWSSAVRRALAALPCDLRVVLHDQTMPLAEACLLRAGDILPIDPAREVVVRVGDHALARGTVAPDGHGGHRVTVAGRATRGLTRGAATHDTPISEDAR